MSEKGGGRKFKRKLTPFLAHQMLFDYATDQLDAERRSAIEEFLETDQEGRGLLANLRQALSYTDSLSKTSIDSEILEHLKDAESPMSLGKRYSSWNQWPEPLRWSLSAIAISCVVAAFVALVPWNRIGDALHFKTKPTDMVQVAEIPRPEVSEIETAEEPIGSGDAAPEDESSGDEEMGEVVGKIPAQVAASVSPTPGPMLAPTATPLAKAPVAIAVATPVAPKAIAPVPTASATPVPTPHAQAAASVDEQEGETVDPKAKGFVYRAFMTIANIEDIAPQLSDAIRGLGGEKAGEVELGWKRGTGRYYHFALPEENEKKLMDKLQAYGPVRLSKDPHPRVMPPGRVRIILWVESSQTGESQ